MEDIKWAGANDMPNPYKEQFSRVVNRDIKKSVFQPNNDSVTLTDEKSIGDKAREENIERLTEKIQINTYRYVLDYNEKIKRIIVKAVDNESNNVIRQTPSEGQVKYLEAVAPALDVLA